MLRFLNARERQTPAGKVIHVILDKRLQVVGHHPRWVFHITPNSCSWPNAVENFFAKLTPHRRQRGVFPSLVALQDAINRFSRSAALIPVSVR